MLLRQLNETLEERGLASRSTRGVRKHHLAKRVLAGRKEHEPAIGLPVTEWVEEESRSMVEELQKLGPALVGDYAELEPVAVPGVDPTGVDPTGVVAAGVDALIGLLDRQPKGRKA
jgi:hypothetical protein